MFYALHHCSKAVKGSEQSRSFMHEFSIVSSIFSIIEDVARENNLKKIDRVTLTIGKMRQVVPVAMEMAFEAITKETIAEDAALEMEFLPIIMRCQSCDHEFTVEENVYICPSCDSTRLEMIQGQELLLKNIEGEN